MNQLINQRVGKKKKSGKKGCLFLFAGSLCVVLCVGLFIWAVSALTGVVIESRHGGQPAYALMTALTPCYGAAFSLFMGIMGLWYFAPSEEEVRAQYNRRLAPKLGEKEPHAMTTATKCLISGVMLAGVVLAGLIAVNSYRLVTPDGISTYFFTETDRYEWKQVSAYTIDCDSEDGLSVTFTMRDGKKYEILQGVNSTTAEFDGQYTSVTHFAADIDEQMVALQVPRNVKHMERAVNFYLSREGLWPYVSKLIGYAELVPEPDETAPVTEAGTEAGTEE
jgi:hypothetical protein